MKPKMGRPKLPKNEAKGVLIGARFSPEEAKEIQASLKESNQNASQWLREAAQTERRRPVIWVRSKWTKEELADKTVAFRLVSPNQIHTGVGEFIVTENLKGELRIFISVRQFVSATQILEQHYWLAQKLADRIEKHPDPALAQFRLWM